MEMNNMYRSLMFIFIAGILLLGCEKTNTNTSENSLNTNDVIPQHPFPFKVDPVKSGAYIGRDYMSVYLVGDSNIVLVNFDLLEVETPLVQILIGMEKENAITHYSGPEIEKYVLPQGVKLSVPTTPDYLQKEGISGFLNCGNTPLKGRFEYGRRIKISLEKVDFGDGKLYQLKPITMTVAAFPP